jgi:hypothetical protein
MGRIHDDAGAVAILVALSVSTFLLGFAALAVDFGQVYMRQGELQSIADVAALAGATELPDAEPAREKALLTLCSEANRLSEWDEDEENDPDICPEEGDAALPDWISDGDDANGEIFLYARDSGPPQGGDGFYQSNEQIEDGEPATAIRVLLPRLEIQFGLARSLGAGAISVSKAATARIGTPEGAGMLPFAVTVGDLRLGAEKEICVLDLDADAAAAFPGNPTPGLTIFPTQGLYTAPTDGQILELRRGLLSPPLPTDNPRVFIEGRAGGLTPLPGAGGDSLRVTLPPLPGGFHDVWIQSDTSLTQTTLIVVIGGPAPPEGVDNPCPGLPIRPVLDIGRRSESPDANLVLGENLKHGLEARAHRISDFPDQFDPAILDPILAGLSLRCSESTLPILGVLIQFVLSLLGDDGFSEDFNCVSTRDRGFGPGLTTGLLDQAGGNPGRLLQACTDEEEAAGGRTIDGTDLFEDDDLLVGGADLDPAELVGGSVQRGIIKNDAFRCPRLGMVPVVQQGLLELLEPDDYPIVDFAYVWIDDNADGLIFNPDNSLRGVRFHIIDPGYFNQTVTGSLKVGPYRGENFPKEIVLVRDIGDQP